MRASTLSLIVASLVVGLMVTTARAATVIETSGSMGVAPVTALNALPNQGKPQTLPPVNALVPEPMSWVLTLGGLGMVGAALRRRSGATA